MRITWIMIALALCTACSQQSVYEGLKQNNRNECNKMPESQRQLCLEKVDQDYQDYQREREALLKKPQ